MNITPQTEVHLISDVPFNLTYNNVRDFNTKEEQITYFLNKTKYTFDKLTYQRVNQSTITLEISYDEMLSCNYMMFKNAIDPSKWYYAFITDYEFISPNVTRITYQLDVYQTYLFDYKFQTTYIERQHTKRFNSDGSPVVNTLDEGLAYGSDYEICDIKHYEQLEDVAWVIIVAKVKLEAIPSFVYGGTNIGHIETPLYFYATPINLTGGNAPTVNGTRIATIRELFNLFTTNPSFVGTVVSMYYTSYVPFQVRKDGNNIVTFSGFTPVSLYGGFTLLAINSANWGVADYTAYENVYEAFPSYDESKLLMYPYSLIEVTNQKGETFTLKPENLRQPTGYENNLNFKILSSIGIVPKTAIIPEFYLNNTSFYNLENELSYGIIDNDVSDIPIVDDYTASYIQANKNSINLTNKYAVDNANRGIMQNNANNRIQNAMLTKQEQYSEMESMTSMIGSALSLNASGMISSGISMTKAYDLTEGQRASMNMNNDFANENLRINAEQSIGLTQAKMQDINNIPPTISNLGNNPSFDYGNNIKGFYVIAKTIKQEYREQLTNYFRMFGYKVNKMDIPNTKTRKSYNYIKTIDANIVGNIPNVHLNTLKGIFDHGLTIWHTNDVGNYSLDNREV